MKAARSTSLWSIGAGLGAAFLVITSLRAVSEFAFLAQGNKVLASVRFGTEFGAPLFWQLAGFGVSLLLVHVLMGLLAATLARLTLQSIPAIRIRPGLLVAFWFVLLSLWVLYANAAWYPATRFEFLPDRLPRGIAGLRLVDAMTGGLVVAMSLVLALALWRHRLPEAWLPQLPRRAWMVAAAVVMAGSLAAFAQKSGDAGRSMTNTPKFPNVIVIGIDSLRTDVLQGRGAAAVTPSLNEFLGGAQVFTDTTSPLARTYPAWISVLTGQHPVTTGARFNLVPRDTVRAEANLAGDLAKLGYRTLYATDEVRFANIDESFGFDTTVTPPIGAGDFILGTANDLPLTNVLSNTWLGKQLFPHTYANRAAHVTYRPETFTRELARSLPRSGPVFVVTHLTLAHVPYSWAGRAKPEIKELYRPAYEDALREVDRQFASIMGALGQRGLLDDAIVVLLSDHGEALGEDADSLFGTTPAPVAVSAWGHGTSVLNRHQYEVLLAVRGFGARELSLEPAAHDVPASLEDIRPTLLDLLDQPLRPGMDGLSLGDVLRGEPAPETLWERIRFTETGFNTPSVLQGSYDPGGALHEGAAYYDINPENAWVQLKTEKLPELMRTKERAAIYQGVLLAALPGRGGSAEYYVSGLSHLAPAVRVDPRSGPGQDPRIARLADALHGRFPGEIR